MNLILHKGVAVIKRLLLTFFLLFSVEVDAATIDSAHSAVFMFNTSAFIQDSTLLAVSYSVYPYAAILGSADENLAANASMSLSFGTYIGGDDIGSFTWANPFSKQINNMGGGTGVAHLLLDASLDTLYVTVGYVNDIFAVNYLSIKPDLYAGIQGVYVTSISPVPVPPAFMLFLTGLGFIGLAKRFHKED
jgi:hypothetical protein